GPPGRPAAPRRVRRHTARTRCGRRSPGRRPRPRECSSLLLERLTDTELLDLAAGRPRQLVHHGHPLGPVLPGHALALEEAAQPVEVERLGAFTHDADECCTL